MRSIRILGTFVLWLGALLGVVAGVVWVGSRAHTVQPMVVISGSMQPAIGTGDLLIDRWIATSTVEVGDVLSLASTHTDKAVTHRVVSIERLDPGDPEATAGADGDDAWAIRMKGDDNAHEDPETYVVGDQVLTPWIRIPQGGKVVSKVMEPAVAIPIIVALVALLGISLLDEPKRQVVRRVIRLGRSDPRVDELDEELAAVGVDVEHLRAMDDLDLALYALGIDVASTMTGTSLEPSNDERSTPVAAVGSSQSDAKSDDERTASGAVLGSSEGDGHGGLWDFQLPPSDAIEQVRPPSEQTLDEPESVGGEHREPTLTG